MRTSEQNRHENAELVKTIGTRLKEARELNNMSQQEAARLFGYRNSSKLSKMERAVNSKTVPLVVIAKAARIYQVSIDYLFGLSADWDTGARMTQERETSAWLLHEWESARERDMQVIRRCNDRMQTIDGAVETCIGEVFEVDTALTKFRELNESFEEMRGGATLLRNVERCVMAARESRAKLKRFHMECKHIRRDSRQGELFEDDGRDE